MVPQGPLLLIWSLCPTVSWWHSEASPPPSRQQQGPWPWRPLGCRGVFQALCGMALLGQGAGDWAEEGSGAGRGRSPEGSQPSPAPFIWILYPGLKSRELEGVGEPLGVGLGLLCALSGALALTSDHLAPQRCLPQPAPGPGRGAPGEPLRTDRAVSVRSRGLCDCTGWAGGGCLSLFLLWGLPSDLAESPPFFQGHK